jgi:hypothetical protein
VRTITSAGEPRIYWGKDLPRAWEEAGAKVGDSITATRVASKPVRKSRSSRTAQGRRSGLTRNVTVGRWIIRGLNREALIKAYDVPVKSPEDRKKLEISAPLLVALVAARDAAVVELKREKLTVS